MALKLIHSDYTVPTIAGENIVLSIRSIVFAISLASAPLAAANAAEWRTGVYETDGFSVDFSGSVNVQPIPMSPDKERLYDRSTMYIQDGGSYAYFVGAYLVGANATYDLDIGVRGAMEPLKCSKIQSDATSSTADGKMREINASGCNGGAIIGAKFIIHGRWVYSVFYLIESDNLRANGEHFLRSFKPIPVKS